MSNNGQYSFLLIIILFIIIFRRMVFIFDALFQRFSYSHFNLQCFHCAYFKPVQRVLILSLFYLPSQHKNWHLFCIFFSVITVIIANLSFTKATLDAAIKLHNFLLHNLLRIPISFFDVTPIGRILARFSSDINNVDTSLPSLLQGVLSTFVQVRITKY